MFVPKLSRWLPKTPRRSPRRPALGLMPLEAREVPATVFTWSGNGGNSLWGTAGNWQANVAPTAAVTDANLVFPAGAFSINDIAGFSVDRITFNGSNTILLQQQLGLDGSAPGDQIVAGGAASTIAGVGGLNLFGTASQIDVTAGSTLTFNTNLSGPGLLRKLGTGTLELTGQASYAGITDVRDGILALNNSASNLAVSGNSLLIGDGIGAAGSAEVRLLQSLEIPNAAPIVINADGRLDLNGFTENIGDLTLAGGSVMTDGGQVLLNGKVTANANSSIDMGVTTGILDLGSSNRTIDVAAGMNLTITAQITGSGGIVKTGAGKLTFDSVAGASQFNTYTGTTAVNDGSLILDNDKIDGAFAGSLVIGDGTGAAGSAFVQLMQNAEIPDATSVTVKGDGLLDLAGHSEAIGPLTLHAGGAVNTNGSLLVLGGDVSVIASVGPTATITGNLSLGAVDRTITVFDNAVGSDLIINGVISGAGGLIKDGAGTLELKGLNASPNTFGGQTTVKQGTLLLNDDGVDEVIPGTLQIGDGVGAAGTAIVQYAQSSELRNDKLVTILGDGLLDLNGKNDSIGGLAFTGGQAKTGAGLLTLNGDVSTFASGDSATITGNLSVGSSDRTFTVVNGAAASDLIINGIVSGNAGIIKDGAGTLEIKGGASINDINTFTGQTLVKNGVMILNHNSSAAVSKNLLVGDGTGSPGSAIVRYATQGSEIANDATVTVRSDGQLDLKNFPDTIGSLVLGDALGGGQVVGGNSLTLNGNLTVNGAPDSSVITGNLNLAAGSHTFTIADGSAAQDLLISASIGGAGDIVKTGPGTLVLSGNNNRTGTTTVNAGTLLVTGSSAAGPFSLAAGLLGGTGAIGDLTTTGGTVSPGVGGPGTLTTKNLTLSGATVVVTLDGNGVGQFDELKALGSVSLSGANLNRTLNFASSVGSSFTIIDNDGADPVVGTFTGLADAATFPLAGRTFQISYHGGDGNDVVLTDVTPNTPPTISDIGNQTSGGTLGFTVGDVETPAAALSVTASSSNPALATVNVSGSGANRTVTVTPVAGQSGTVTITLTVTDANGGSASDTFDVAITPVSPPAGAIAAREFAIGTDKGGSPTVRFLDHTGAEKFNFEAFAGGFTGGVRTAAADFNGDGVADIVVGTGPGGPTHVRVLDGVTKVELFAIDPFEAAFTGGVYVAAGDITGDGRADLMISPDEGGGPRVRVFNGAGFGQVADFLGIEDPNFRGGARVAVGDIDGDGVGDLVVAAGFGGGPRVAAFSGKTLGPTGGPKVFPDFLAFEPGLRNGTFVAVGDLNGDGYAELIGGGGPGGGPRVSAFDGQTLAKTGNPVRTVDFFAGDVTNRGGVRLAVKDLDGDTKADILTGAGTGAGSTVTGYAGSSLAGTPTPLFALDAFPGFLGGVFVG